MHTSLDDELAQKRLRLVNMFKREEEEKFDERDKVKKDRKIKRSHSHLGHGRKHSVRKRSKSNVSCDLDHVCSSSCPAKHWMTEDEEWIEKDTGSEDEDHPWFPEYTSDISSTTEW